MKIIKLTKGYSAIVDDSDFDSLSKFNWFACIDSRKIPYARANNKGKVIIMHRLLAGVGDSDKLVDHKNRNTLDNRKENLRICTRFQNNQNRKISVDNKSGHKGVNFHRHSKKWVARISVNNKRIALGYFNDLNSAAKAYNRAAIEHHGEFALLNKTE